MTARRVDTSRLLRLALQLRLLPRGAQQPVPFPLPRSTGSQNHNQCDTRSEALSGPPVSSQRDNLFAPLKAPPLPSQRSRLFTSISSSSNGSSCSGRGNNGGGQQQHREQQQQERQGEAREQAREQAREWTLKDALRQLYKRVHPDTLHNHPHERAANERSFQLLQEYLAVAHITGAGSRASGASAGGAAAAAAAAARRSFEFEFFIREEISSSRRSGVNTTASSSSGSGNGSGRGSGIGSATVLFRHVTMALPPPQRPRVMGGSIPLRTRMALSQLLDACGLPPHLTNTLASATASAGAGGAGAGAGGMGGGEGVRLSEVLVEAAEIQRQCEAGWTDGGAWNGAPDSHSSFSSSSSGGGGGGRGSSSSSRVSSLVRDRAMMVHVLRMVRGVTVHFDQSQYHASPPSPAAAGASSLGSLDPQHQEVLLLEQLIKALDRTPDTNLSGSQVVIGAGRYRIDSQGRVWLKQGDELGRWAEWLARVDTEVIQKKREWALERRVKERAAACGMEVEMVFTDALTAEGQACAYDGFLQRMVEQAEEHGAVCGGRLFELPVRVVGQPEGQIDAGERGGGGGEGGGRAGGEWLLDGGGLPFWSGDRFHHQDPTFSASFSSSSSASHTPRAALHPLEFTIDRCFGYAAVPITATGRQVYEFLSRAGADAMAIRRLAREEERRLEQLRAEVRQRLKLRRLAVDEARITRDQAASGFLRLLRFAAKLAPLTEGLSLCVSDAHRLPLPHGGEYAPPSAGYTDRSHGAGSAGRADSAAGAAGSGRNGRAREQEWESSGVPFVHVKWNFSAGEL
ncbi:hypothetical protein CLOM_g12791 [Closterium sp. NIES-68]|nr:hypothetical protein CLOM_g12791 [Closterium sp. NIES-68]